MDERIDYVNEQITLIQKRDGLTFGTDAYLLYAYLPKGKRIRKIADLGGGTGILSLLTLSAGKAEIAYCVEIQPDFVDLIGRNAERNQLSERLIPICKDVRKLTTADTDGCCDLVLTNPPYLAAECGFHNDARSMDIARREICGSISDFCQAAARILRFGGYFYAIYRPDRLVDLLCTMRESGIEPKRLTPVLSSAGSLPSLILCEGRRGGAPGLFYTKPLILYESGENYTNDLKRIYERGEFDESYRKP